MKQKSFGILVMCMGISVLLVTLVGIYIEFFVPKLGPIGTGERHISVYIIIINSLFIGIVNTILGIVIVKKHSNSE